MAKQLRKAIVLRSRWNNIFKEISSSENRDIYKKQRNFCQSSRKIKKSCFESTNIKEIVYVTIGDPAFCPAFI